MIILGISIGTRTSGIAILTKRGLVHCSTVSFKNSWSEQKAQHIVRKYERFIQRHKVTVVALKIPPLTHRTQALLLLLKQLQEMLAYHGCMVQYKTKADIKQVLPGAKNTKDIMMHTARLYPPLILQHQKELQNRNKYHDRMFEAVIVAHLCKQENSYPPD